MNKLSELAQRVITREMEKENKKTEFYRKPRSHSFYISRINNKILFYNKIEKKSKLNYFV